MSSSEDEVVHIPNRDMDFGTKELGENVSLRSYAVYSRAYQSFMDWRNQKQIHSFSEEVFLDYFEELTKKYQPSSLWCIYSMLRATMLAKHDLHMEVFHTLKSKLKQYAKGYKAKRSKVLTAQDIQNFLNDAPNEKYLVTKVVLIFGISGGCRTHELLNLTVDNIKMDTKLMAVTLPEMRTNKKRQFVICGDYLKIVRKYLKLRPSDVPTNRFFLNYQKGKCTKQVIGRNKFGAMPQKIAAYLKLPNPELYTGHCFRRSSGTLFARSGVNIHNIRLRQNNSKQSELVAETYTEDSMQHKSDEDHNSAKEISIKIEPCSSTSQDLLFSSCDPLPQALQDEIFNEVNDDSSESQESSKSQEQEQSDPNTFTTTNTHINLPGKSIYLVLENCMNCTFNFS